MPMDFPDMKSLERAAEMWKFRKINDGESEDEYRVALANYVKPHDFIESEEIRNGVSWDKFDNHQNASMVFRSMVNNMK